LSLWGLACLVGYIGWFFCLNLEQKTGFQVFSVYSDGPDGGLIHFFTLWPMTASTVRLVDSDAEGGSQAVKAQQRLRELILAGDLPAGARIAELALVERLGMSRTPIRAALMHLKQEGLLEPLPGGGYAVRTFSEREVADAIELRGTLEGLAARLAAERGVRPGLLASKRVLAWPRSIWCCATRRWTTRCFQPMSNSMVSFTSSCPRWPTARCWPARSNAGRACLLRRPRALWGCTSTTPQARDTLVVAQHQHRQVLDAIERREAGRAEALMREHSRIARQNMQVALRDPAASGTPGVQLIRPS
jgi:GntR family transcriptional regulator, vanillate catabolism transcriptional regulator